jgi:hypothetical protein
MPRRKASSPKLLVVIGDLHCGSVCGLALDDYTDAEGVRHRHNKRQAWIWHHWLKFWDWVEEVADGDPWVLAVNGDVTEGVHHRTTEVVTNREEDHADMAIEILAPIMERAARVLMTRGTDAHVKNVETALAKKFGAPLDGEGRSTPDRLEFIMNGCRYSMAHHMGASLRPWTRASGLGIAMQAELSEAAAAGHERPQVMLRAHRHVWGMFQDVAGMVVCSPPWQLDTRYVHRIAEGSRPHIGGLIMDHRGAREGERPTCRSYVASVNRPQPVIV